MAKKNKVFKAAPPKQTPPAASKAKGTKVTFLISPTGHYGLGYHKGDTAEVDPALAKKMIEKKHAKPA